MKIQVPVQVRLVWIMKPQSFYFQWDTGTLPQGADIHFNAPADPFAPVQRILFLLQAQRPLLTHALNGMIGTACLSCPLYKPFQFFYLLFFPFFLFVFLLVNIIIPIIYGYLVRGLINEQDFIYNLVQKVCVMADNQNHAFVIP